MNEEGPILSACTTKQHKNYCIAGNICERFIGEFGAKIKIRQTTTLYSLYSINSYQFIGLKNWQIKTRPNF